MKSVMPRIPKMVTPCVGVWIETFGRRDRRQVIESHPAWVCGLKLIVCMLKILR